jgi:hypothetical protein
MKILQIRAMGNIRGNSKSPQNGVTLEALFEKQWDEDLPREVREADIIRAEDEFDSNQQSA